MEIEDPKFQKVENTCCFQMLSQPYGLGGKGSYSDLGVWKTTGMDTLSTQREQKMKILSGLDIINVSSQKSLLN